MGKILSQAGISMADTYDIEGSIVGVENLDANNVSLVEDMGPRVMAERMKTIMVTGTTGALADAIDFNITVLGSTTIPSPDCASRVLSVNVYIPAANATEIENWSLTVRDQNLQREAALITWDIDIDSEVKVVWNNDGAGAANFIQLRPLTHQLPGLLTRAGDLEIAPLLLWRGTTAAVVATTVTATLVIQLARPNRTNPAAGQPSSHGLPIPSW